MKRLKNKKLLDQGLKGKLLLSLVLALTAASLLVGSALTASNTVPNTVAGDGAGNVSGYTISGTAYDLDIVDPSKINGISFAISPIATTSVKIKMNTTGNFYTCVNTSGQVYCATTSPQLTVAAANTYRVIAIG